MYDKIGDSEEERQAIEKAVDDFHRNPGASEYRMATSALIQRFRKDAQSEAQAAIKKRDEIMACAADDVQYATEVVEPQLDDRVRQIIQMAVGKSTLGNLNEEESFELLSTFIFVVEMFRYCCARDNRVYGPMEVEKFVNTFVAQVESDFNPLLARYLEGNGSKSLH